MHIMVNSLYEYNPCKYDRLFPFVGNDLTPGQLVRVMRLPRNDANHVVVAALRTSEETYLISSNSLERFWVWKW